MTSDQDRPGTFSVVIQTANPIFILLSMGLPIGALVYALNFGSISSLNFVCCQSAKWDTF